MGVELLKHYFQTSDASGSKSTILKPLTWFLSITITALITGAHLELDLWILVLISIFTSIIFVVFVISYLFCLTSNMDALRSEKYSIQKIAIEKGVYGDNLTGLIDPNIKGEKPKVILEKNSSLNSQNE